MVKHGGTTGQRPNPNRDCVPEGRERAGSGGYDEGFGGEAKRRVWMALLPHRGDADLEAAILAGKFDALAARALQNLDAGRCTPLDEFLRRT